MGLHSCETRGSALVQHQMLNPSTQTDPTQSRQCSLSSSLMTIGWGFYYFIVVLFCFLIFSFEFSHRAVITAVLPPSHSLFKSMKNEVERLWRDTPAQKQSKSVPTVWLGGEIRLLRED